MGNIDILDTLERLGLPCVRVVRVVELGEILSFWKEKEEKRGKRKSYEVETLSVCCMNEKINNVLGIYVKKGEQTRIPCLLACLLDIY